MEVLLALMTIGGIYFIFFAFWVATYVFNGLAILNLCKKLGIQNGGLGFVPVANVFKLGQAADRASAAYGEKKHYARLLLIMEIVTCVLFIPYTVCAFILAINGVSLMGEYGVDYAFNDGFAIMIVLLTILFVFLIFAAVIAVSIFTYIAYYKIFRLFVPDNAVLYLVLSLVLGLPWLFLFIASRKMPVYPVPFAPINIPMQNTNQGEIQ